MSANIPKQNKLPVTSKIFNSSLSPEAKEIVADKYEAIVKALISPKF